MIFKFCVICWKFIFFENLNVKISKELVVLVNNVIGLDRVFFLVILDLDWKM